MKTSIPSDVWETKKSLIAKLYKDEEWPLKQVIKQIRTDDFNPSETQLRSRLKKWRVTKPSRQTRKKLQESPQHEMGMDEDHLEESSPTESRDGILPHHHQPPQPIPEPSLPVPCQPQSKDIQGTLPEWYTADDLFPQRQQSVAQQQPALQPTLQSPMQSSLQNSLPTTMQASLQSLPLSSQAPTSNWATSLEPQQSLKPQDQNANHTPIIHPYHTASPPISASNSYELHHPAATAPTSNAAMSTTAMITPAYNGTYDGPSETCLPSPVTPAIPWSSGLGSDVDHTVMPVTDFFPSTFEGSTSAATVPYYSLKTTGSTAVGYSQVMSPVPTPEANSGYVHPSLVPDPHSPAIWEGSAYLKPYRRAISLDYKPAESAGHVRVDRQGRQRKPLIDRKRKEAAQGHLPDVTIHQSHSSQPHLAFIPHEQHMMMPAEMFSYPPS